VDADRRQGAHRDNAADQSLVERNAVRDRARGLEAPAMHHAGGTFDVLFDDEQTHFFDYSAYRRYHA
jgi:hypothetical protein